MTENRKALPQTRARRYVTPLREGGSLPAIIETDAGRLVVAKWRGAGQGPTALVAEVIAGELGRALGLPVPELEVVTLTDDLGRNERDQEIRDLLRASLGTNLGMGYLSGALAYDPAVDVVVDPQLAARVVIFDAFVMNVDRTARNTNLLWWEDGLWLIDHGAALYWHHGWDGSVDRPTRAFPMIRDHVLLGRADSLVEPAAALMSTLSDDVLRAVVDLVPDGWLVGGAPQARRDAYVAFLAARRDGAAQFVQEAEDARVSL